MEKPIRILIIDDHALVRAGIRAFTAPRSELEIIGEAADGIEGVELSSRLNPDVILLDLVMPQLDGIETTRQILQHQPGAKILILTSFSEDERVLAAVKAGALGYLLKDSAAEDLYRAIIDVYHGQSSLHPMVARKLIQQLNQPQSHPEEHEQLTQREQEVLVLLSQGLSNQQIAAHLYLSSLTVRSHISSILKKLNLENRTQAALYAVQAGLGNSAQSIP
jgi:two-component system, NarL family, response regulator LiaR